MKHIIISLSFVLLVVCPAFAQELRTSYFMQSSYYRHEMNPALLDSPYLGMPLVLGNLNLGMTGNMGLKNFIYKMQPDWQGYGVNGRNLTTFMHPEVDASSFLNDLKDRNSMAIDLKYQLFSLGFKGFKGMNVVEINLRSHTAMSLPKSLFEFMKIAGQRTDYQLKDFGVRTENYLELGLGHSHKVNERLTVGGKMKFLLGAAYADFETKQLNLHLSEDYWQVNGDIHLSAALMQSTLKYENSDKNYVDAEGNVTNRRRISGIDEIKGGLSGWGLAFDMGATYQVLPNLKVSAAVTDLGFIRWNNAHQASSAGTWKFEGFENDIYFGGSDTGNNTIENQIETMGDDLEKMFAVYEDEVPQKDDSRVLAATLNLGVEYTLPVYRKLRLGFLYTDRMAGLYSYRQGMLSAAVSPVKWFEASCSMAVGTTGITGGLVANLHAKHFSFFLGTDRFFGKISKQYIPLNNTNAGISMGFTFPL